MEVRLYFAENKKNYLNNYVPEFVPSDLKWYERDGFMTWYDQVKCEQFLEDVNKYFSKTKIVNFDIINKSIKGEECPKAY